MHIKFWCGCKVYFLPTLSALGSDHRTVSLVYGVQIIGRRVTERSEEVGQDKKGVDGTQDTDPLL